MPLLITIDCVHYSPKDSETATKELIIANNFDQALEHIDKEYLYNYFKDGSDRDTDDGGSGYFTPDDEWWEKNPTKKAEAQALGLKIEEYGSVSGVGETMTKWLSATTWKEVSDAYYGVTHFDWSKRQEITNDDAATLLRLGLAKDLR